MAFGEAIFAEAVDLPEAAPREIGIIAAPDHAADHLFLQLVDRAGVAEGRHRATQLIGFGGREAGSDNRQPHRLFLEQWHAAGAVQYMP